MSLLTTPPIDADTFAATADELIGVLSGCRHVLLTTHARPDGDALGTTAAMSLALARKGIASEVWLPSAMPAKYAFVYTNAGIDFCTAEVTPPEPMLEKADALLVCDTGTWSQLPGLREAAEAFEKPKLVLDHHVTQEAWADLKLVDTGAAAAAEVAAGVIRQWGVSLDNEIAEPLYVGLAADTGWFMFSNTTPRTMRLAADLMEAGVDIDLLYQRLHQSERACRVRLHARGLQSLELLDEGRLAIMRLTARDFADTCAEAPDTEDLINVPLQIGSVEVSVLLSEMPEAAPPAGGATVRCSFRSKGAVDVARLAQQFGGGGHQRASGARFQTGLEEAQRQVVEAVRPLLR